MMKILAYIALMAPAAFAHNGSDCTYTQIESADGRSCVNCPTYTNASNNHSQCSSDNCYSWQSLQWDGTCKTTASSYYPRAVASYNYYSPSYYQATCNGRQRRSPDGTYCINCPSYTRAQLGNSTCASDQCTGYNSILLSTGSCIVCASNEVPDAYRRACVINRAVYVAPVYVAPVTPVYVGAAAVVVAPACNLRQRIDPDGYCANCPAYTRAQDYNQYCQHDVCYSGQIQTTLGSCSTCAAGTTPSATGKSCVGTTVYYTSHRYCASNQILDYYGGCVTCPAGTQADAYRRNCYYSSTGTIRFIAMGSDLEGPEGEETGTQSNTVAVFITLGAILLTLTIGTGAFVYKNKKLYFQSNSEPELQVEESIAEVELKVIDEETPEQKWNKLSSNSNVDFTAQNVNQIVEVKQ